MRSDWEIKGHVYRFEESLHWENMFILAKENIEVIKALPPKWGGRFIPSPFSIHPSDASKLNTEVATERSIRHLDGCLCHSPVGSGWWVIVISSRARLGYVQDKNINFQIWLRHSYIAKVHICEMELCKQHQPNGIIEIPTIVDEWLSELFSMQFALLELSVITYHERIWQ